MRTELRHPEPSGRHPVEIHTAMQVSPSRLTNLPKSRRDVPSLYAGPCSVLHRPGRLNLSETGTFQSCSDQYRMPFEETSRPARQRKGFRKSLGTSLPFSRSEIDIFVTLEGAPGAEFPGWLRASNKTIVGRRVRQISAQPSLPLSRSPRPPCKSPRPLSGSPRPWGNVDLPWGKSKMPRAGFKMPRGRSCPTSMLVVGRRK